MSVLSKWSQWLLIAGLLLVLSQPIFAEPLEINFSEGNSKHDHRDDYFIQVLKLAMEKSAQQQDDYILIRCNAPMTQARRFQSVKKGRLDITWGMSSPDREMGLTAIPFPLLKGLIGYRVLLVHQDNYANFKTLNSRQAFQQMKAIQGTSWPDVKYLTDNGFKVITYPGYEALFNMLRMKRTDYFPRSVEEVWHELEGPYTKDIRLLDHVAFYYHAPIYFFVSRHNTRLIDRLSKGLEIAYSDGSFQQLFDNHPNVIKAKAFLEKTDLHFFKLKAQQDLPSLQHIKDDYWYYPASMKVSERSDGGAGADSDKNLKASD